MSYAVRIGTTEAIWVGDKPAPDGWVIFKGDMRDGLVWGDDIQNLRDQNDDEKLAALAAKQAEEAKRIESHTARDDAKRALAALDTIIAGAPTATIVQLRAAVEQMARIQKHHILATLGR